MKEKALATTQLRGHRIKKPRQRGNANEFATPGDYCDWSTKETAQKISVAE